MIRALWSTRLGLLALGGAGLGIIAILGGAIDVLRPGGLLGITTATGERITEITVVITVIATRTATATSTETPIPSETAAPTPTTTLTPTNKQTATITPQVTLPAIEEVSCIPAGTIQQVGQVINIVDGDTIDVRTDEGDFRVRYIGIDSPEQAEPMAAEASSANQSMTLSKTVTLVRDVSETDRFDRLLRYVIAGDTFINYELVLQGFARESAFPPDTACRDTLSSAQATAMGAGLGIWKPTATPAPTPPPQPTQQPSNCHPAYPTVCIPPPPPDLDCGDIPYRRFTVLSPDPHNFDGDGDGVGCESG